MHSPLETNRRNGGAERDRTDDLLNANQALSQLSYSPNLWNRKIPEADWMPMLLIAAIGSKNSSDEIQVENTEDNGLRGSGRWSATAATY